ncbi:hypothetical protein CR513_10194, partial [Mucuna pruriens]
MEVSITNSAPNGVVSLQIVNGSVLNEELRRKTQGSSFQSEDDDCVTTATSDDLVILRDFESVNLVSDESMWTIDNGATLHVIPRKEFFTFYTSGVKHASDIRFNLISVHMLDDGGYDNHFGHGKWKLTKDNLVVARGEKISKLYWTKSLVAKDSVNVMDMEAFLWHQRLSHIIKKWLNCLSKKDMLPRLKNVELEKYSHCMAGKQTRVSFKKHPPSRKLELLELVHSDVCGPLKVKSFSGALYSVTFIDDFSKKLWVYVLKTKDQVLEKFKQFQALVKRQLGKKVKCIRSDNGGEYYGPFDLGMYGYRIYDPVEKKLVRSCDVQFMKDETIEDIDKNGEQHNYVGDQQLGNCFDVPPDDDVEEEQEISQDENLGDTPKLPPVQLSKSNRQRQSFTRYTFDEYVTLTDGQELECYQESMESEERQKTLQSKLQKCVALSITKAELGFIQDDHWLFYDSHSVIHLGMNLTFHSKSKHIVVTYHWIYDTLDAKLLELAKVHIDDNGADMMTKTGDHLHIVVMGRYVRSVLDRGRLTITRFDQRRVLEQILEKRTSKQIWDSIKKIEGNARVKSSTLQTLRRDVEILEMKVGETITKYFA